MMQAIIHKKQQRELEQASYTFQLPISLAVLTHITRHRMHSLMVPDFVPMWNLDNYVIPETIAKDHEEEYREIFANNKIMMEQFKAAGVRDEDLVYFYLAGNACNITTTMNARTLEWISRMRSCNKAQWEIRGLVNQNGRVINELLNYLRPQPENDKYPIPTLLLKKTNRNTESSEKNRLISAFDFLLRNSTPNIRRLGRDLAIYAYYSTYNTNKHNTFFDVVPMYYREQYD